jgi:hypothetical protein
MGVRVECALMAAKKRTREVVAIVDPEYFNRTIRILIEAPSRSRSDIAAHLLVGDAIMDDLGVWFVGVTSRQASDDDSPAKLDVLVPWAHVFSLGVVTHERLPIGFSRRPEVTVLR